MMGSSGMISGTGSAESSGSDVEGPRRKRRRGDASEEAARPPEAAELQRGWVHDRGSLIQQYDASTGAVDLQAVTTESFWRGLASSDGECAVHCCDATHWASHSAPLPRSGHAVSQRQEELQTEGYTRLPHATTAVEAAALATAIARLVRAGWHPLWCLVFDESWLWLSRMRRVLEAVINKDAVPNFDYMAWYIDPCRSEAGWVPHRDRRNMPVERGAAPLYCTVWLALTEATPLNGCMHILPADRDIAYGGNDLVTDAHDCECAHQWVQDIRALPCKPAEALVWTGRALHFGGRSCARAPVPRISIACALSVPRFEDPHLRVPGGLFGNSHEAAGTPTEVGDLPADGDEGGMRMPSLLERLRVITVQLLAYDAPLESKAEICEQQRRLVHALESLFNAEEDSEEYREVEKDKEDREEKAEHENTHASK